MGKIWLMGLIHKNTNNSLVKYSYIEPSSAPSRIHRTPFRNNSYKRVTTQAALSSWHLVAETRLHGWK